MSINKSPERVLSYENENESTSLLLVPNIYPASHLQLGWDTVESLIDDKKPSATKYCRRDFSLCVSAAKNLFMEVL